MSVFHRVRVCAWRVSGLLLVTCLSCGGGAERSRWNIVVAEGTMEGVPRLAAVRQVRIDGYEADLVPINWLGVAPDSTIAILQHQDNEVRFFDSSGSLIGRVGGDGEGPGEFRSLVRGGWKADTLWVSDPQLARVTLISPERLFLRTLPPLAGVRPLPQDSNTLPPFPFVFPYAVYEGDSVLVTALTAPSRDPRAEALGGLPLLVVSSEGWIGRVLTVLPISEGSIQVALPNGGVATPNVPYFPRPLWAVSPDGTAITTLCTSLGAADQGLLTVTVVNDAGAELLKQEFSFDGVPIPQHVVDSVLRVRAERASDPEVKRAYESGMRHLVPRVYPPVQELVVGNDHRIWIGLRATGQGKPWLVLNERGIPVGTVIMAAKSSVRAANTDHVWVVEWDDLDVESVVRYRIEWDYGHGG